MKEMEEWGTGHGIAKWQKCFDCGQFFHGAVQLALGWAMWKTYLGRPEADGYRTQAMGVLGTAVFENRRPEEALPVLEAYLALLRHYCSRSEDATLIAQTSLATCLTDNGRHEEALVLCREVYARRVAALGLSHEDTIMCGANLAGALVDLHIWDDAIPLMSDQLLPAARRSLGSDHHVTLAICQNLAAALDNNPERTRDNPRSNQRRSVSRARINADPCRHAASRPPSSIPTQATTCSNPRPSCWTWSRDGGGSLAPRIRRRANARARCPKCERFSPRTRFGVSWGLVCRGRFGTCRPCDLVPDCQWAGRIPDSHEFRFVF